MYCIKCGVKLADSEKQCPLCGTVVFHPEFKTPDGDPLYPRDQYPRQVRTWGIMVVISMLFLLPLLITLLCDLQINRTISWSGYVIGALLVAYVTVVLPFWFHKPNPVIFVPCSFAALGVYLLYIDLAAGGHWFLSFAFPVTGFLGIVITAVVTLLRYIRRGRLYIYGGAALLIGAFMPLMEFLMNFTFHRKETLSWSFYPLVALIVIGGILLFLAICRPAREAMERRFFI